MFCEKVPQALLYPCIGSFMDDAAIPVILVMTGFFPIYCYYNYLIKNKKFSKRFLWDGWGNVKGK